MIDEQKEPANQLANEPTGIIEEAQSQLVTLESSTADILKWCDPELMIATEPEQKNAEDLLIVLRRAYKTADEKRKEMLKPVTETRNRINELFKPHLARIETATTILNRQLSAYHLAIEKAKEEARKLIIEQEAARMAEARADGELVKPLTMMQEELPQPQKTSRTHLGRVTYREDIEVTIINLSLIPRDLMVPDMAKIKARLKSGMDVPGVVATKKVVPVTVASGP